ncbi:hypothetical protein TK06_02625 [Pseudomonas fluorescens]|uniref:Uncharacterized protein n=1 Tax=Pseudomonas fluorescens TaxID=294 RepID=A0A159ZVH7_PSEFL|nr:hypothetical protein TK06_02625 [Pseudomonas fluorescens]
MSSGTSFQTPGQVAGLVMIGAESSYTSSGCFLNMEKALAGQDDPVTRLNQRDRQAVDPVERVGCLHDTRGFRLDQGCESSHVNSFSMVYRRIAEQFG